MGILLKMACDVVIIVVLHMIYGKAAKISQVLANPRRSIYSDRLNLPHHLARQIDYNDQIDQRGYSREHGYTGSPRPEIVDVYIRKQRKR